MRRQLDRYTYLFLQVSAVNSFVVPNIVNKYGGTFATSVTNTTQYRILAQFPLFLLMYLSIILGDVAGNISFSGNPVSFEKGAAMPTSCPVEQL